MIYFIRHGNDVKIGYTKDVATRLRTLRTATANDPVVLGVMDGDLAAERDLHARFSHLHVAREWFSLGTDIVEYIEAHCRPYLLGIASVPGIPSRREALQGRAIFASAAVALASIPAGILHVMAGAHHARSLQGRVALFHGMADAYAALPWPLSVPTFAHGLFAAMLWAAIILAILGLIRRKGGPG